ncbi:MAG: hypothetical protein GEU73_01215 [Chloroflexi bacterium]|nr:hypothetical protein [Chloroflexota bacterium]
MAATAPAPTRSQRVAALADLLGGVILEVRDLATTRSFYEPIFSDVPGTWQEQRGRLVYRTERQAIEFVKRARPRSFADSGQHQAYRVRPDRIEGLTERLAKDGHEVNWWREDNPAEHEVAPYVLDPDDHRVQLVGSSKLDLLLDHAAMEIHAFDYCERVYRGVLGGTVSYYHGWRVEDEADAKRWGRGEDPAFPWSRRDNPGWFDFARAATRDPNLRVPRPATQVFLAFGSTTLGLISASKTRQELPEEIIRGLPRLVFHSARPAEEAFAHIEKALPIPWEREGSTAYVRDPDGNFAELRCAG